MVNLAQVREPERMGALFVDALGAALAPARFALGTPGAPGRTFEVRAGTALVLEDGVLEAPVLAAVANGARLLGLLQDRADLERRLEEGVAARTAELARSAERFRRLFDSNAGGVLVHAASGEITQVNPEGCRLLGLHRDEVLGRYSTDPGWHAVFEDGRPAPGDEHPSMVALRSGRPVRNTVLGIHHGKDAFRWLLVSAEPVCEDGVVREVIVTFQDVTAMKRAEEERRRLEAQHLQAQKLESLGVLAGGIAHDFNNLLTGVLGGASLARQALPPDTTAARELEDIERAARQAAELTSRLLAYVGKGPLEPRGLDLSDLVRESVPLVQVAVSKKCTTRFLLAPSAPILGDRAQLRQTLLNLVVNGSEALSAGEGTVTVATRVERCEEARLRRARIPSERPAGDFAVLEVCDTGSGMDEATQARVFDPFFSTRFTGRGLGLPAVMGIVRSHGGALELESAPGRGCCVRVLLPVAAPAATAPTVREARRGSGVVLVADDEQIVRTLAKRVLSRAGFEVVEACDGRAAVDVIRSRSDLRLVVLDATMPKLSGPEALAELRPQGPLPPVLLSSGHPELAESKQLRELGVTAFLAKPYTASDLLRGVFGVLDAESGSAARASGP